MFYQIIFAATTVLFAAGSVIPNAHVLQPYKFGFIKNKHGQPHREESGYGAGPVADSYEITNVRGIKREVNYVADKSSFKMYVNTDEPGTSNQNPTAVIRFSDSSNVGRVVSPSGYGGIVDGRLPIAGPIEFGRVGFGYSPLNGHLGLNGPITLEDFAYGQRFGPL